MPQHKIAPCPYSHFLSGSARDTQRDPLGFGLTISRQFGDVVRIRLFIWPTYLVNLPDGIKHVLQENQQNYNKDLYPYKIFKLLLGRGLVTNGGKSWLHQRRLMQPAFHRKSLDAFGSLMTGATVTMLNHWENVAERNQPLDVAAEMQRLTLYIAGKALFNIDLSNETHTVSHALTTMNKLLTEYLYAPYPAQSAPTGLMSYHGSGSTGHHHSTPPAEHRPGGSAFNAFVGA